MAQLFVQLCSLLVENAFGDVAGQIFSIVAAYGRVSLLNLLQFSDIPRSRLDVGLTILVQHHLVLHHAPEDEDDPTYFEPDMHTAYALVRSRKLLDIIHDREGEAASKLVANIFQLGHASVGDLAEEYGLISAPKRDRDSGIDMTEPHVDDEDEDDLVNGTSEKDEQSTVKDDFGTLSEFHTTLSRLLEKGFLVKVNARSYMPDIDLEEHLRDTVSAEHPEDSKTSASKREKEVQFAVNNLKRKWHEEDDFNSVSDSHGDVKSPTATFAKNKRIKTNDMPNGVHHDEGECERVDRRVNKLPNDMVVRVNLARAAIFLRTQRFEEAANESLGPTSAAVYSALLRSLEDRIRPVRDTLKIEPDHDDDDYEETLPSVSDLDILENLDQTIDLTTIKTAIQSKNLPNGKHRKKTRFIVEDDEDIAQLGIKQEASDSEDENEDDEPETDAIKSMKERKKRLDLINKHLEILSEHPKQFCTRAAGNNKWRIDYSSVAQKLILSEIDSIIYVRHDKISLRLVRLLRENKKEKLDEKYLAPKVMQPVNDTRALLTALLYQGLVEAQELPKDSGRQPSRIVYLWWFDEERVRSRYLRETYQGMVRLLQRTKHERERVFRAALEKAEQADEKAKRADVQGKGKQKQKEKELLNAQDKAALEKWDDVQELFSVHLNRLDEVVAVMRDFDEKRWL